LVDGRVEPPDRWIWNYLPDAAQRDHVDFMHTSSRDWFPKWGKLLAYYPAYWHLAMRALRRSRTDNYDLVVAWESKHGFPLAALRRWLDVCGPKLVILAFSFKGIGMNVLTPSRQAMRAVDHVTVPSYGEIEYYGKLLDFPADRMTYCPLGWYDFLRHFDVPEENGGDYVFAGGRSYRDYRTLFEAMAGSEGKLIVNARRFNLRGCSCPPNVKINDLMPVREYYTLMAGSQFVVLPLQDTPYAAGLLHIIQAMSAGKAIIVTRTAGTVDYVEDGETGILVSPYDVQDMRSAINYLLSHPAETKAMGQRARQRYEETYTFTAFAERTYEVLNKVASSG
jgi:glycosyltransferase involved in cell wall biosynthesis